VEDMLHGATVPGSSESRNGQAMHPFWDTRQALAGPFRCPYHRACDRRTLFGDVSAHSACSLSLLPISTLPRKLRDLCKRSAAQPGRKRVMGKDPIGDVGLPALCSQLGRPRLAVSPEE
jgi:hypothetical protein